MAHQRLFSTGGVCLPENVKLARCCVLSQDVSRFLEGLLALRSHPAFSKELETDLIAIDPIEFTAAVRQARGRKHQEEFFEFQSFN